MDVVLQPRQQQATSATQTQTSQTTATQSSATGSVTGSSTSGSVTGSVTGSASGPATGSAAPSSTHIPVNAPPGQIIFTQPPLQSASYYKIAPSQYITFGWNFTQLYITPTSLTVSAVCENGNTYPIGPTDGKIPGNAQSVVWYPYGYQTANPALPLAQAKYTLHISGGVDQPLGGQLESNDQLQFALYTPQPYTPIGSGERFACTCSHIINFHARGRLELCWLWRRPFS